LLVVFGLIEFLSMSNFIAFRRPCNERYSELLRRDIGLELVVQSSIEAPNARPTYRTRKDKIHFEID
jgi:hypothetical protein